MLNATFSKLIEKYNIGDAYFNIVCSKPYKVLSCFEYDWAYAPLKRRELGLENPVSQKPKKLIKNKAAKKSFEDAGQSARSDPLINDVQTSRSKPLVDDRCEPPSDAGQSTRSELPPNDGNFAPDRTGPSVSYNAIESSDPSARTGPSGSYDASFDQHVRAGPSASTQPSGATCVDHEEFPHKSHR